MNKKEHIEKAKLLVEQGAKAMDLTKSGKSDKASALLTQANIEREKAGLIKGGMKR